MKYTSQFADINDKIYTIEIVTNNSTAETKELLLGENPLVIQTKSQSIFDELKFRTARITLITTEYLNDIYNPSATGTSVLIKSDNEVIFYGYVTPNTYSQDYNNPLDELEIECIEDVSILKYYDYSTVGVEKTILTVRQLLNNIFKKIQNPYTKYYVFPNNIKLNSNRNIDTIYLNENNFFDNDSEQKPWKCEEILKELCKYFNLSCTKYKDTIYFIDYSALKKNITSCSKVNYTANTVETISLTIDKHTLTEVDSADSDCSISKDDTYNEIRITSNSYPIDDYVIPELYTDNSFETWENINTKYRNLYKSYYDNTWKQHLYDFETHQEITPFTKESGNWSDYKRQLFGIFGKIMKTSVIEVDDNETVSVSWNNHLTFGLGTRKYTIGSSNNDDIYYSDYRNVSVSNLEREDSFRPVCLELKSKNNEYIYSPIKGVSYILFNGTVVYASTGNLAYDADNNNYAESPETRHWRTAEPNTFKNGVEFMEIELSIGNKYWNGSEWTTTKSTFNLKCGSDDFCWNTEYELTNNVNIESGIEKKGFAIPMLPEDDLFGVLSIKLHKPKLVGDYRYMLGSHGSDDSYSYFYIPYFCHIKDFSIEFYNSKGDGYYWIDNDNSEDDTEYFNIINENYVTEFNDMELKINTQNPDKKLSVSSTMYNDGSTMKYITTLNDTVLNTNRLQENNIIERFYNHYCTPKNIIERTIYNYYIPTNLFNWRQFNDMCIDTQNWNVKYNTNNIKLIEI